MVGCLWAKPASAQKVCPNGATIPGIDVSQYQGAINWNLVAAAGYQFAFARVNDGPTLDSSFAQNYAGIQAAGMIRGAYQFFEPSQDPAAQAILLLQQVGAPALGDLPPVLDVEITGGLSQPALAAAIQTWVSTVQSGLGRSPIVYTAPGFWNSNVGSQSFSGDPLWVANWGVSCPTLPIGWPTWAFWQFSDSGTVSGVSVGVDLDEFNGNLADLQQLGFNPGNHSPVASCTDVSVTAGPNSCSAMASIDNGSYDPDTGDRIVNSTQSPPGPYPVGTTLVTLTVTDSHDAIGSCQAKVTVCPGPVTIYADSTCSALVPNLIGSSSGKGGSGTGCGSLASGSQSPAAGTSIGPGVYPLTVNAADSGGNAISCQTTLTVLDTTLAVESVAGPVSPLTVGSSLDVTVQFTDCDTSADHVLRIDWGDNSQSTAASGLAPNSYSFPHTYLAAGVYAVTATVTAPDGETATGFFNYVVIYDPTVGFITGGGWIDSPPGALTADMAAAGPATFGFVSKYQKGANAPTGQTEFQFALADFDFHSTSYQWLVISGAKGQFKGSGTINGLGAYDFLLTATDGQLPGGGGVDKFRIKISDPMGGVIYDNVPGAPIDINSANPEAIVEGQIIIHSK
jgi:GH25 family lysozyme M1 (1,4-beta-N-acetylmuramidase)